MLIIMFFTQINKSVIDKVMEAINQPIEKAHFVMTNTVIQVLPVAMAFHEGVKSGKIKRGDKVLFVASGAGLSSWE